jgi:anti-anti-sigma factor
VNSEDLNIDAKVDDSGHSRVHVTGEIDLATVQSLVDAVGKAIPSGGTVELDLRDVDFMDSAGVAGINRCRRMAGAVDADLVVLCRAGGSVAQLLEWTGLVQVVDVRVEA